MEKETKNKILYFVLNAILSIILSNLGIIALPENKYIGAITIMIAFILLYFSFTSFQIKKNEESIKEIKENIKSLKQNQEMNWKILNSSLNNKLIEKLNKILKNKMNKRGISDIDILEILKIIILIVVGYIIIKALFSLA